MCLSTGTTDYWFVEGTSIAAPKVSAIAGLILCEDDTLTPKKVAKRIYKSSEKIGGNKSKNYYGDVYKRQEDDKDIKNNAYS